MFFYFENKNKLNDFYRDVDKYPKDYCGSRPFNFKTLFHFANNEFEYAFTKKDKIVVIGDQLTTDIMFGNLVNM